MKGQHDLEGPSREIVAQKDLLNLEKEKKNP